MTDPVTKDEALERAIDREALMLLTAKTPEARRVAMNELRRLISLRSEQQVERMERRMGLR